MVVEYENTNKFKALIGIVEDYTEWFSRIALLVAYREEESVPDNLSTPNSFAEWAQNKEGGGTINPAVLVPILEIETSLDDMGKEIAEMLNSGMRPPHSEFVKLKNMHSSFLTSIRRLEKDSALEIGGVDELTGMRPAHVLKKDLDKEMGRLERNGSPFTLLLIRIDEFEGFENSNDVLDLVAKNVKQYLRPFDDVYYLEAGFFLLSLKHADMPGGEVVAMRIQNSLDNDEDNINRVTVSGALSEPVIGDEVFKLLDEMKADLGENPDVRNTILKFLDISPLEKFVISKS